MSWTFVKIAVWYSSEHSFDGHGKNDPCYSPKFIHSVFHEKFDIFTVQVFQERKQDDWEKNNEEKAVDPDDSKDFVEVVEVKGEVKLVAQEERKVLDVWLKEADDKITPETVEFQKGGKFAMLDSEEEPPGKDKG
jgi:hypothetical protein